MFELFYDLVFVYAIFRITAMIHHSVNGSIPLITFHYFNIAMAVMVLTLFCQYLFVKTDEDNDKPVFLIILGIEFALIVLGLIIGYPLGIYFCIAGYTVGFILPLFLRGMFKAERVNFSHLVERVSLIIIIVFGEANVNLTTYFNSKTPLIYAVLLFLSLIIMFANYVILSDKLINHHKISKGLVLIYSHIAIVIAVLLTTVAVLYLRIKI